MIPLWTIPMAAVTGNTLILKPSERDPGAAMMIAELCNRAGLPPGVVNVVHGAVPTVNAICDHPAIRAISFVGGDKAGKHIYDRYITLIPLKGNNINITSSLGVLVMASASKQILVPRTMRLLCLMVCSLSIFRSSDLT
jgi:acyl-CoA reductase-like NAD-dependent aldehyde dehydrogenase